MNLQYLAIVYTVSTVNILHTLSQAVLIVSLLTHTVRFLCDVLVDTGANACQEILTGEGAALATFFCTHSILRAELTYT